MSLQVALGPVDSRPSFALLFRPNVQLVTLVRTFVSSFFQGVVVDADTASRLALATHELLENAVKYSSDGETLLHVEVDKVAGSVSVRVRNRATPTRIAMLEKAFEEIAAASDADSLYMALIRRSASANGSSGGLGLARIWSESELTLALTRAEDEIEIHASGRVTVPPGT